MKIMQNIGSTLTRATCLAGVAGLALLGLNAAAQEKGAERLMKLQRLSTPAEVQKVAAGDTVVTTCPKCKDTWVTVVQPTGKAVNPHETKALQRHECPGCQTRIVISGVGRQAHQQVVHTCQGCGSQDAFCCVKKKDAAPAKGATDHKGHNH